MKPGQAFLEWVWPLLGRLSPNHHLQAGDFTSEQLADLDLKVRETSELLDSVRQPRIDTLIDFPQQVVLDRLRKHTEAFGLAVLFSYSRNGYVREAAVRNLAAIGERSLPYLVLRTCDWVPTVANLAEAEARKLLPTANFLPLHYCLQTLRVLDRYGKLDCSFGLELLREIQERSTLHHLMWVLPNETIQFLIDNRIVGDAEKWPGILKDGLSHADFKVNESAVRQIRRLDPKERVKFLLVLQKHKLKSARLEAVEIAEVLSRKDTLIALLNDKNWRVRMSARYSLEKFGPFDFADHYRVAFPSPIAIAGFGETVNEADLNELLPFLQHTSARVRCEAIRGLQIREVRSAAEAIVPCLFDGRPTVVRTAISALKKLGHRITVEDLNKLVDAAMPEKAERLLNDALDLVPRWLAIEFALRHGTKDEFGPRLNSYVQQWVSGRKRDFSGPTPNQLQTTFEAYSACKPMLSKPSIAALEAEFAYWKKRL